MNSLARRVALFALALAALLFGGAVPATAQTNNSTPPKLVGYLSRDNWGFVNIMDFDYDPQGNLYVLESGFGITRVSKFRPDGTFERTFGQRGTGYGELGFPADYSFVGDNPIAYKIRVDSNGFVNVFLDFQSESRWTKFTQDGDLVLQRQRSGYIDGLSWANGGRTSIVSDLNGGFFLVIGEGNTRIERLSGPAIHRDEAVLHLDAAFNSSIVLNGSDGVLIPSSDYYSGNLLAIGKDGTRYLVQTGSNNVKVLVFNAQWTLQRTIGGPGSGDVQFNNPTDIKVLTNGNLWIHDAGNGRWQEITPTGEWVSENRTGVPPGISTPLPGQSYGDLWKYTPSGYVAVRDGKNRYLFESFGMWPWGGSYREFLGTDIVQQPSIQLITQSGSELYKVGGGPLSNYSSYPIDPNTSDLRTYPNIDVKATEFTGFNYWSRPVFDVTDSGSFVTVTGFARQDQIDVVGSNNNVVVRYYTPDKQLLWQREVLDSGLSGPDYNLRFWKSHVRSVRIKVDRIYVFVSGTNPRTVVYDFAGNVVATGDAYPSHPTRTIEYGFAANHYPTAIYGNSFMSADGRAYDPTYSQDGLTFMWTQTRQEVTGAWEPRLGSISVGPSGRTFRVHRDLNKVERSEWDGSILSDLGAPGSGYGQFSYPSGIAAGLDGTIYVSDSGNGRVQRFTSARQFLNSWTVPYPGQIEVRGNTVYVMEGSSRIGIYSLADAETTAPVTAATQTPAKNLQGWNKSNVAVTLRATDNVGGAGVVELHYTINGGTETVVKGDAVQLSFTTEGEHTISYFAVDYQGNSEAPKTYTVKIDKVKPTTTKSVASDMVTLSATDDRSGVMKTYYAFDGATAQQYIAPIPVTGHNLRYWSVDNADNVETTLSEDIGPTLSTLTLSPIGVTGGNPSTGTVTLTSPAPASGVTVTLTSSDPSVTLPASVTIAQGDTTATFAVTTTPVPADVNVTISATGFGTTLTATLAVVRPVPALLSFSPAAIPGGGSGVGTVFLSGISPAGDTVVTLQSTDSAVTVPSSVTVPAGQTQVSFAVTTTKVPVDRVVAVHATAGGASTTANVTVTAIPGDITTVVLNASTVAGGQSSTATISASLPAPAGGITVTLSSSSASATVPATATIAEGTTSVSVNVTTVAVANNTAVTISANQNGLIASGTLNITAPRVTSVVLSPKTIAGGSQVSGTVTLSSIAPSGGTAVSLSSSSVVATVPATVTVAAGSTTTTFTVDTAAVAVDTSITISAVLAGDTVTDTLTVKAPTVQSVVVAPATVTGGTSSGGTVTLSSPAPAGGREVQLSSNNVAAQVPSSVTVLAGQTTAVFAIQTSTVNLDTVVTITGSSFGSSASGTLTVESPIATTISFSPASVVGGVSSTGTISLSGPAPSTGLQVSLSSNKTAVTVPATITVPAGATEVTFNALTAAVAANSTATITATIGARTATGTLTVTAPQLTGLTVRPVSVPGGTSSNGTVTLSSAAPVGGVTVALSSSSSKAGVPATVTIVEGATSAQFTVTTVGVAAPVSAVITGTLNGISATDTLTVTAPTVVSVTLDPTTVPGGRTSTGTVNIGYAAPAGGVVVSLASSNAAASVPASVTVAEGATKATFTVTTIAVSANASATITASSNGTSANADLTVTAPRVSVITVSPSGVAGGSNATGIVSLDGTAPVGGLVVSLSSSSAVAGVPATMTIAEGQATATFTISTVPVASSTVTTITATSNGTAVSAPLTVMAPAISSISVSPTAINGGNTALGIVTLDANAPAGGLVVSLLSSDAALTVPASVTIAAGQRAAVFNVSTSAVSADTNVLITGSAGQSSVSGVCVVVAPRLTSVSVAPSSVVGSNASNGTVVLTGPAPAGGTVVALASDKAEASVPATVTVAAGTSSKTFTINTVQVSASVTATITGTLSGASTTGTLVVNPPSVTALSLASASVAGGVNTTATVTLADIAGPGGVVVNLASSNTGAATVPATVTVPNGASTASFTVTTAAVATTTTSSLTASTGVSSQTATLTVTGGPTGPSLSSVTLNPTSVAGGASSTGTVTLSAAAPAGGLVVSLASSSAKATVPASVTVAAGQTTATFTATTTAVAANAIATITATLSGVSQTASLTITAATLSSVTLNPTSVAGGASSTGTVTLSAAAPASGLVVTLASSSAAATVPASVTVAAGQTTATFTVTTTAVAANTASTITATLGGVSQSASLGITAPVLSTVALNPTSVTGGTASTGTVTLLSAAPAGGMVVTLASSSAAATLPASVTVAAGQTTATFTVNTTTVTAVTAVTITATSGVVSKTAALTVNPAAASVSLTSVTVNLASVVGGAGVTGTVTLSGAAPAGGVVVTLTSSSVSAKVPVSVTVPAGATSATFAITTVKVTAVASVNITGTYNAVSQRGTLQVTPTCAPVTFVLNPTSVKGGTSSTGTITLNGPAPAGGAVVTLKSSKTTAATVAASVTVPAGATTVNFTVSTKVVSATTSSTITVTAGGVSKTASLSVTR